MILDILYGLMFIYMIIGMAWRFICLFRKKGS